MTTQDKSREAFEANYKVNHHFWHSSIFAIEDDGSYVEIVMRDYFQNWQAAEAYGRKRALEDAVELASNWAMTYVIEDNANLTVGDYIAKELIK
jgi:hypothetical protein